MQPYAPQAHREPIDDAIRLFVGNFPFRTTEHDLIQIFAPYGQLYKVQVQHDRDTGLPRGFGFIEMERHGAVLAIEELHGAVFGGRKLEVKVAVPKQPREAVRA